MARRDIIAIGGSAGAIDGVGKLAATLPPDLSAAVFVVVHLSPRSSSLLPELISRRGPLQAVHPVDGMQIEQGKIYVAPPDQHLILEEGRVCLGVGPKENLQRPCINVTFRSAAQAYGPRVIGVVLSGQLDDGTAGLWDIKRHGGLTVVQHPEEAPFPSMPLSALREMEVDYTVRLDGMGPLLTKLSNEEAPPVRKNEALVGEPRIADVTCPECGGNLWEIPKGSKTLAEYRCRVGHSFSPRTLIAEHFATEERTLWSAIVALEEGAALATDLADNVAPDSRRRLVEESRQKLAQASHLRRIIEERKNFSID